VNTVDLRDYEADDYQNCERVELRDCPLVIVVRPSFGQEITATVVMETIMSHLFESDVCASSELIGFAFRILDPIPAPYATTRLFHDNDSSAGQPHIPDWPLSFIHWPNGR
jgi:hypothetical protein